MTKSHVLVTTVVVIATLSAARRGAAGEVPSFGVLMRSGDIRTNLVLQYSFEGRQWYTVTDESGSDNHGKVQGARHTDDAKVGGGARTFNGRDAYIDCGEDPGIQFDAGESFTFAAWFRPATKLGRHPILDAQRYGLEVRARKARFYVHNGEWNANIHVWSSNTLTAATWYHLAGVFEDTGTERRGLVYVDGALCGERDMKPMSDDPLSALFIGRSGHDDGIYLHGSVDEVMIWRRALSAEEISLLYAAMSRE